MAISNQGYGETHSKAQRLSKAQKNKNGDIPFEASRVRGSANHGSALHLLR